MRCKGESIELAEVLGLLADANESNRQLQAPRNGDHDAPFRSPIELRENQPRDAHRFIELNRLRECVLTLVGIEHEQYLMRSRRVHTLDDSLDLLQLFHEVRLAVQAPRCVSQENVRATRLRGLKCVEHDSAGIGARLLGCEFRSAPLSPHVQLFNRGGAECITGCKHHAVIGVSETARELSDASSSCLTRSRRPRGSRTDCATDRSPEAARKARVCRRSQPAAP